MKYKLALIQAEFDFGKLESNLKKAENRIREAADMGANLIVLPESFNQGYIGSNMQKMVDWSEPLDGPTTTHMAQLAKELKIYLVPPIFVRTQDGAYENTAILISDSGEIVGTYAKTHLVPENEKTLLRAGREYPVFDTKYGKIGFIICNDLGFPEPARLLGIQGAEVIIMPAAWRYFKEWDGWWESWISSRARDNMAVFAAVNQVGPSDGRYFSGGSMISGPDRTVLTASHFPVEDILIQEISLEDIRAFKKEYETFIVDRRTEDYQLLCQKSIL